MYEYVGGFFIFVNEYVAEEIK